MFGVAFAVAGNSGSEPAHTNAQFPPSCAVAINATIGLLPRAELAIENRSSRAVAVFLEARGALPRIELGAIGPGERKVFAHTLPAGRNMLLGDAAEAQPPRRFRAIVQVNNHGAATCRRRYLWRIG